MVLRTKNTSNTHRIKPKEIMYQQIYRKFKDSQYIPNWVLDSRRIQRITDEFNPCINVKITTDDSTIIEDQMQAFEDIDINLEKNLPNVSLDIKRDNSPHRTSFKGVHGSMTILLQNHNEVAFGKRILEGCYIQNYTNLEYKFYDVSIKPDCYTPKPIRENSYNFESAPVKIHFSPLDICNL